jgi:hypothetical protein
VHLEGAKNNGDEFRPINMLPVYEKAMESVVKDQFYQPLLMKTTFLLSNNQDFRNPIHIEFGFDTMKGGNRSKWCSG